MGAIMKRPSDISPLRKHATDVLRRARKLPVGPDRNDLRQLAIGLLWLEKNNLLHTNVQNRVTTILALEDLAASVDQRGLVTRSNMSHALRANGARC
jgi:hypothetical protein